MNMGGAMDCFNPLKVSPSKHPDPPKQVVAADPESTPAKSAFAMSLPLQRYSIRNPAAKASPAP